MSESNKAGSITKDKLIADMKQIVADADALLQATTDQTGEKIAGLRTRLQDNLTFMVQLPPPPIMKETMGRQAAGPGRDMFWWL
jgi:hypothetical protein